MIIQDLSIDESMAVLSRRGFGRLACARDSQPYIVPMNFSVLGNELLAFSTVGRKIEWMRLNPLVCVEVDEVETQQKWKSVIVMGKYHEAPRTAQGDMRRQMIHQALQKKGAWWEPGYAKTVLQGATRPLEPVYFTISIDSISGHSASP